MAAPLLFGVTVAKAEPSPAESESRTIGLAITTFRIAHYSGENDCPNGLTPLRPAQYLEALSPEERERLKSPERDPELVYRATMLPSGGDTATFPNEALARHENFPMPFPVQGKVSFGLNLDGADDGQPAPPGIRPHRNFIGPNGELGIDNELYRALGCSRLWRWDKRAGESVTDPFDTDNLSGLGADSIRDGQSTLLIEITDVDDRMNDPDVTVGFFSGLNPMVLDAQGKFVPFTSQTADPFPLWQNQMKGRIVNGILETVPTDLRIRRFQVSVDSEFFIRAARFRLELKPDGTARGILAGYMPVGKEYWPVPAFYHAAYARGVKAPDTSFYRAMYEYADAYPDPETGQYTAISMARAVTAVPTFIFHESAENKAARVAAIGDNYVQVGK